MAILRSIGESKALRLPSAPAPVAAILFFVEASYEHVGPEVILRGGSEYVYLDTHDADRLSVGEFWRNITHFSMDDHHMGSYLSNIEEKVRDGVRQVPYFGP